MPLQSSSARQPSRKHGQMASGAALPGCAPASSTVYSTRFQAAWQAALKQTPSLNNIFTEILNPVCRQPQQGSGAAAATLLLLLLLLLRHLCKAGYLCMPPPSSKARDGPGAKSHPTQLTAITGHGRHAHHTYAACY